jgi:maltooligosyltrehalose trehalohydrolase
VRHRFIGRFGPLSLPDGGYRLRLFAPAASRVDAIVDGRTLAMTAAGGGWFNVDDAFARARSRYRFAIDGGLQVPDPASRFQPDGVHAASEIVDASFEWPDDGWRGRPWAEHVLYELHVGTFTYEGTYLAAIAHLDELVALGVTAIELMPLAAFPGTRNWGYDGVLPYAPFAGYGTPGDLKRLIVAAHARGLAVLLDVVYNHFGPEGNYLAAYAPSFFTDRYHTPWGSAIDVTVPDVRRFFIDNALYWLLEYRFDGLRFDATNQILDPHPPRLLDDLRAAVTAAIEPGRHVALVVENDDNDVTLLEHGFTAQWNDDVHHCLHVLATGESDGYYRDYASDPVGLLGRALTSGYAYQGEPSAHRSGAARGASSVQLPLTAFVGFLQNHDQIGNRALGERLARLTSVSALRASTALLLLAPSPPLLFMGEEWGASTSFLFFCDFEPGLAQKVTEGRRREFAAFPAFADPRAREVIPDPSAPTTRDASVLRWDERDQPWHAQTLAWYSQLLHVRAEFVAPVAGGVRGTGAGFARIGSRGLALWWQFDGGVLHCDAILGDEDGAGFAERLPGTTFFSTHGERYGGGTAPGWSVRWSRA